MLTGTCHCGAVSIEVPRKPRRLTSCNCSICRRYGSLMAYYPASKVRLRHARGAVDRYAWGDKMIDFVRCATCGCFMGWQARRKMRDRMGVNMRNFDPAVIEGVRIRRLDGASTWKFLD
ncbi:MAG TPA: GFA family protein [Nevskiaceae bacterium]|nr:GFA family protein [Nevskiaceae bacterium]